MKYGAARIRLALNLADRTGASPEASDLDSFLQGLRSAWREGEIRPTARLKQKQKRERRRPDPLIKVTDELKAWFDEEPWLTSRQLLERLQEKYRGEYRDLLLRTLQRRVKIWRKERAHAMVFGVSGLQASSTPAVL